MLEEGEVFIQIRPDSFHSQTKTANEEIKKILGSDLAKINASRPDETILDCDVLVTKNPCSHPGDIQKV